MANNLIEKSKENFQVDRATLEHVNTGCLQRIANAVELMATNYIKLQSDNEYLRIQLKNLFKEVEFLKRQSAVYKGKFNRLRKKQ